MTTTSVGRTTGAKLRRGETVRVRSAAEILASLDEYGDTENLPFMPEMLSLCGRSFQVSARADKTCDTVNLTGCTRQMSETVHLVGARCDGSAHGGCEAGCLFFFKESWLETVDSKSTESGTVTESKDLDETALAAKIEPHVTTAPGVYRCQATQLPNATRPMAGISHYVRDVTRRNVSPRRMIRAWAHAAIDRYQRFSRNRLPTWARIAQGVDLPNLRGKLTKTPTESLDLQPGEIVEVKSLPEIIATLDVNQRNRNLWFDREMIKYCGKRFRVQRRVNRLLDEKTGRMMETKNPCIILDGPFCLGDYNKLCPRLGHLYFREIWLRRVDALTPS
jgi:hypothetical protein